MNEVDQKVPFFARRPWVMGILNVTPDSFSDGGRWDSTGAAIERGRQLVADGADIVDVGGESTRPGAHRVDAAAEADKVVPVIRELSGQGVLCSVDTTRARVAEQALAAGAGIVNDVSGGLADPDMIRVVAEHCAPWILMHWRGPSEVMWKFACYDNVVADVRSELLQRIEVALAFGIDERSLIIDPGLGFAKNAEHNWQLLDALPTLVDLGLPVLVGASRKRFLGDLLADSVGLRPAADRETATAAISLLCAQQRVWAVRVHETRPTLDALAVMGAVDAARHILDGIFMVPPQAVWPVSFLDGAPVGREPMVGQFRRPTRTSSSRVDPNG